MDYLSKLRIALISVLLVALVACGGEDTLNGESTTGNTVTDPTTDPDTSSNAASVKLLNQNSQIPSDSSTGTELSAIVRDVNNNFLSGVTVTFQADSGGIQVVNATTDASGRATATLDAAGDPQNRTISVQATETSSNISDSIQVGVTGSTLSIVGPSSVTIGDQVEYLVSLRDSSGTGVSGEDVTITSSLGNSIGTSTLVTDFNGELSVTYNADSTGTDTLTVTSLGLSQTQSIVISNDTFEFVAQAGFEPNESGAIEVAIDTDYNIEVLWESNGAAVSGDVAFSTTRGTLDANTVATDGTGTASTMISSTNAGPAVVTAEGDGGPTAQLKLEFIAQDPNVIDVQASPVSIGPNDSSTITAIVRDENGNLVKNQTILFALDDVSGGTISTGTSETDSLGRAQTVYTASDATSGTDGVTITASVQSQPALSQTVSLTVADKAVFVTIASDYLISSAPGGVYSVEFAVLASDSDGNPVEGLSVDLSTIPTSYSAGCLELTEDNVDDEGEPNPTSARCGNFSGTAGDYTVYRTASQCPNEDVNQDGVLDAGEDLNNNGVLDPGIRAVIEDNVVTDENGRGLVTFSYPAQYAFWYSYEITAEARVEGTETSHTSSGTLPALATDLVGESDPPNAESPYGNGGC